MSQSPKSDKSSKKAWYGARPVFLVAGAVALLAFGAVFGISLDLATRPAKVSAQAPAQPPPRPSHQYVPPKIEVQPQAEATAQPSIFDRETASREPKAPPEEDTSAVKSPPPVPRKAAMTLHAVPTEPGHQPEVAVVIDDMGLDRTRALKVIGLRGPLTLSLMTYADGLQGLVELARKGGHEVMAHLPMEPLSAKENPGPGALKVNMDEATIRQVLASDLDSWSGYVGVNNHMGSKFTKDSARMAIVMEELKARGLLWLDSKTVAGSAGPAAARAAGVPYLERDVFLDNIETVEAVNAQLDQLEALAKAHGSAIGIGHPHDPTVTALRQWLPSLASRGIALVPVTEILKRRGGAVPSGEGRD